MHLRDAPHSEAVAGLAAIDGALRIGANRIIFESDSSNLVKALNSREYDNATIGMLVKEARSLCTLNFVSSSFSFSRRECNGVAHKLAKCGASDEPQDFFWEEVAPCCIVSLLASDSAVPGV